MQNPLKAKKLAVERGHRFGAFTIPSSPTEPSRAVCEACGASLAWSLVPNPATGKRVQGDAHKMPCNTTTRF